jgi:CRISPR-associated protein Cas1
MRRLLNTLYITAPEAYISLDGENVIVRVDDEIKMRLPFVNVESIVCFGYKGASPALMGKCAENNVPICFLDPYNGKFLARVTGKTKGSVFLRKRQYGLADNPLFCLGITKDIVSAKIYNARFFIERAIRDNKDEIDTDRLKHASTLIKDAIKECYDFTCINELRGFEGIYAKQYFKVFDDMILQQKEHFYFKERSKRPPVDNVNCLLSYLYTILSMDISAALETVGLDPYVGFYHTLRAGRASLALDLIEELRAYMVDKFVISMINLKKIANKNFFTKEGGAVLMTDEGRKKILTAWQERKKEIIMHPFLKEKIEVGLIPYAQAQLLARYIRGDADEYPPFICK